MSYQVTRAITRILSGAALLGVYLFHVTGRYRDGLLPLDTLQPWARTMLIFIGIGIAVTIVVEIVFHILFSIGLAVKESIKTGICDDKKIEKTIGREMVEDEMVKLINLKSLRVGYTVAGMGFIASLVFLVLGYPAAVMINICFGSFFIAGIIEEAARMIYFNGGIS